MVVKTSAHYQREYRRRLREQGLIKKEIWIRPENSGKARELEKELRTGTRDVTIQGESMNRPKWQTEALMVDICKAPLIISSRASAELIEGVDPTIHVVMHEYGDLPVFVTVAGDQIIVESLLWPSSEVGDVAEFNEAVLRTHKYFPLSTISLDLLANGEAFYQMFGALSASSRLASVVQEVETLARNVIQATEAYGEFLNDPVTHKGDSQ